MNEIFVEGNTLTINHTKIIVKYPIKQIKKISGKYIVLLKIPRVELGVDELNNILCYDEQGRMCWKISNKLPFNIVSSEILPSWVYERTLQNEYADINALLATRKNVAKSAFTIILHNPEEINLRSVSLEYESYKHVKEVQTAYVYAESCKVNMDTETNYKGKGTEELQLFCSSLASNLQRMIILYQAATTYAFNAYKTMYYNEKHMYHRINGNHTKS